MKSKFYTKSVFIFTERRPNRHWLDLAAAQYMCQTQLTVGHLMPEHSRHSAQLGWNTWIPLSLPSFYIQRGSADDILQEGVWSLKIR